MAKNNWYSKALNKASHDLISQYRMIRYYEVALSNINTVIKNVEHLDYDQIRAIFMRETELEKSLKIAIIKYNKDLEHYNNMVKILTI